MPDVLSQGLAVLSVDVAGVSASVNKICPLSSASLKRRSFTGKKYNDIMIILLMYQSAMLYKYKQNITFNFINTQTHTKKKQGAGNFDPRVTFLRGSIFYLKPGRASKAVCRPTA